MWDAIIDREQVILGDHLSGVFPVAFGSTGARIVSTSGPGGGMLQVWDATKAAELMTLRGHNNYIVSVSMSPDGERIVSGSMDNTIKVWDASTGDEVMTLRGHEGGVVAAVFSPDGKQSSQAVSIRASRYGTPKAVPS